MTFQIQSMLLRCNIYNYSYHNPNRLAEPAQDGGQKSLMLNCRQTVSKTNTEKEEHKYNRNKGKLNKQKQANE